MKTIFTLLVVALLGTIVHAAPMRHQVSVAPASTLEFIENKGQWAEPVRYAAAMRGGRLFAQVDGLLLTLFNNADLPSHQAQPASKAAMHGHALELRFEGAAPAHITAEVPTTERRNYFLGSDASRWAREVRSYRQLRYAGLWPGVEARLYENGQQQLEYDFTVAPGANTAAIGLRHTGADAVRLAANGRLQVQTSVGTLEELAPQAWQTDAQGQHQSVACHYTLAGNVVRFVLGRYDHSRPLTIDPVVVFATYTGSAANNWGFTATYDAEGNLYSGGIAFSPGYPVSLGAFQTTFSSQVDIALIKYNVAATGPAARMWASYLGGNQADFPHSLIVNSRGELLLLGSTASTNFPATAGALQRTFGGGISTDPLGDGIDYYTGLSGGSDIVVSRFSANGSALLGSTYLGGSGNDGVLPLNPASTVPQLVHNYGEAFRSDIEVDAADNVYIASCTSSRDFPAARGFQSTYRGGTSDGVVCKLKSDLTALLWGSYLGGSASDAAYSLQIAPGTGEVYIAGGTLSADLPATAGALNSAALGGIDGFVARLSADGATLRRTTYLGTNSYDQAQFVQLGSDGGVYALGQTMGAYPTTPGLYQNANGRQFIHKLSPDLAQTQLATVFGGGRTTVDIAPTAFLVDRCDRVFVCGWGGANNTNLYNTAPYLGANDGSLTTDMPVTTNAVQTTTSGNGFYLAQFTAGLGALGYGTFYGTSGEHVDGGTSRFDPRGVAYQAVCACFSFTGFPIPPGANSYSTINNSVFVGNGNSSFGCNNAAFVLSFQPDAAQAGPDQDVCVAAGPLRLDGSPAGGTWSGPGVSGSAGAGFFFTPTPALLGTQVLTYTVASTGACTTTSTRHETVTSTPSMILTPLPVVCSTNSVKQLLVATPAGGTWSGPGVSGSVATGFYFNANAAGAGAFQLAYALPASQCGTQATLPVTVAAPVAAQVPPDTVICSQSSQPIPLRGTPAGGVWAGFGVSGSVDTGYFFTLPPGFDSGYTFDLVYNVSTAGGCNSRALRRMVLAPQLVPTATWAVVGCLGSRQVPLDVRFMQRIAYPVGYSSMTLPSTLRWDFGDGTQSTDANPTHTYTTAGRFQPVVYLRFNGGLCETAVSLPPLETRHDPLPNIITPNGDAMNQTFRLPDDCVTHIHIFSRWGQPIFEAQAYQNNWAAEGQPAGLYYYLLEYPDGHRIKGWLEVVK
ncbi:MAG: gliding motility-associated C-terminal domain-containing protein [Janthinobacterium lividum]